MLGWRPSIAESALTRLMFIDRHASQLVGMMDIDSLFPILESCPNREERYRVQSSVVEVFMAGMPPLESSLRTNSVVNPFDVAHNKAVNQG